MPRYHDDEGEQDADEPLDVGEYPDSEGGDFADDEDDLVPCPACGMDVYESAEKCPLCGEYIVHATDWKTNRPYWFMLLGGLGMLAVIVTMIFSTFGF